MMPLRRWSVLALLAIIAVAVAARVHNLTGLGLWVDELMSVETSSGVGLAHLSMPEDVIIDPAPDWMALGPPSRWVSLSWKLAKDDNHPPLYFLLLRGWRYLLGDQVAALRSLSLLIGVVAVVLFFDVMRVAYTTAAGLWGAAVMALAMPQIQFSQEVRGYMLLVFFGCLLLSAIVRMERLGVSRRRVIAAAVGAAGMALTHYYAIGPLLAVAIYLATLRGEVRRGGIVALCIAAAFFALVWGWGLFMQRHNFDVNNRWQQESAQNVSIHVPLTFRRALVLPISALSEPVGGPFGAGVIGAVFFIAPLGLMLRDRMMRLWWLWLTTSVGLILTIDLARMQQQLTVPRYTLIATPAVYAILIGAGCAIAGRPWLRHLLPAAGVLACLIGLPRTYQEYHVVKPRWNRLGEYLTPLAGEHDLVVLWRGNNPGLTRVDYLALLYYARPVAGAVVITRQDDPEPALLKAIERSKQTWLVTNADVPPPWLDRLNVTVRPTVFYPYSASILRVIPKPRSGG